MRGNWNRFFRDMGMEFAAEWAPDGGRRGRRGGGRQRERVLKSGELQLLLLALIEQGPRHGYALIEEIGQMTGGVYEPSPGVVYPTLTLLADMALIAEKPEDGRKLYEITDAGKAHLDERRDEADALLSRVGGVGGRSAGDFAPVGRSLVNLAAALKIRAWEQRMDQETAKKIADILDETAKRIEEI
jgi:DNA-binding PadR family transcriptional regulator